MALDGVDNDASEETKLCGKDFYQRGKMGKHNLYNTEITVLDPPREMETVGISHEVTNTADHHLEVVTYKLARREAGERLKRRTKNHGASNQIKSITKRLHNKMAANTRKNYYHVIEMAAYDNWRENT